MPIISIAAVLIVAVIVSCGKPRKVNLNINESYIQLIDSLYDFGTWKGDTVVQHCTMRLKNVGKESLVINKVETTCGCTIVEYPRHPIKPQEAASLEISYSGVGKMEGHFTKEITIYSNARSGLAYMRIKGNMEK